MSTLSYFSLRPLSLFEENKGKSEQFLPLGLMSRTHKQEHLKVKVSLNQWFDSVTPGHLSKQVIFQTCRCRLKKKVFVGRWCVSPLMNVQQISKQQWASSSGAWLVDGPELSVCVTELLLQADLQVFTINIMCLQHLAQPTLAVCLMCVCVRLHALNVSAAMLDCRWLIPTNRSQVLQ